MSHVFIIFIVKRTGISMSLKRINPHYVSSNVITIASLVLHFMDQSIVHSFLLELSKTNYIYVPPFSFTDEEALEYIGNISTGEKKLLYYGELINRYHEINEQILQENLGEANPYVSCEQLE